MAGMEDLQELVDRVHKQMLLMLLILTIQFVLNGALVAILASRNLT